LVALFAVQKRGTGGIGKVFGAAMIVWFLSIGAAGLCRLWDCRHGNDGDNHYLVFRGNATSLGSAANLVAHDRIFVL
jgi:hypothetical protein